MNKKYNLKLDLQFRCNNSIMKFNQFDNNTSDFFIRITNSGNLVDIEKAIVVLAVIKPSGKVSSHFIEVKNGLVYVDLKPNMKDEIGTYTAKAMLILEDERVVTDSISYKVEEDKIFSLLNDTVEDTEDFTLLTDMLNRLSTIEISEEQRMINEAERILSEENRKIEEAKRVEAELIRQHEEADRAKYDATRESNENIRKQNESTRLANETNRIDEEAKRVEEENKRKLAEEERNANYNFMTEDEERRRSEANAHKEAEKLRVQAENTRVNEEAKRRTTEQARVSAENTRVNNENTRESNEVVRKNNETKRVEAETQRKNRYDSFIVDAEANASNFESYTNTAKVKEEERKSNELDRKSQETKRVSNEVERISNENTRKANEVAREKNETSRQNIFENKVSEVDEKIIEINTTKDNFVSSINTKVDTKISELNTTKDNFVSSVNTKVDSKISELDTAKSDMTNTVSNKVNEVETRFNALTSSQQQDAEVVDARDGETSLKARLDRDIEKAKQVYVNVEGSHISTDSSSGYAKDVEILGNTIQDSENLADIRSVGDKIEGQELYEIPVLSCGKNGVEYVEVGDILTANGADLNSISVSRTSYIPVKSNVSYVFSDNNINGSEWYALFYYDINKQFIKYDRSNKFVSTVNGYVRIKKHNPNQLEWKPQLEEGTVATPYEPYQEDKLTILSPVQLEKVGDVRDRIIEKDGIWGVEKNVETNILNGSEQWLMGGWSTSTTMTFDCPSIGINFKSNEVQVLSDKFVGMARNSVSNTSNTEFVSTSGGLRIFINILKSKLPTEDVAGLKSWLKTNPILVKYQTTQPQFIPLPHDQQVKLRTFASKTNISFGCEIEGTIKAQVPKSIGATVNTHTEQINNLNKELDRVKKLEESTVSTVTTESDFTTVEATSNGYFEDVKLEGKTLVNLFPNVAGVLQNSGAFLSISAKNLNLVSTKTYTILFTGVDNSKIKNYKISRIGIDSYLTSNIFTVSIDNYDTTKGSDVFLYPISGYTFTQTDVDNLKVLILEGDHTQNPPNGYIEGLKSVGQDVDEIVVSSVGVCMFDDISNPHHTKTIYPLGSDDIYWDEFKQYLTHFNNVSNYENCNNLYDYYYTSDNSIWVNLGSFDKAKALINLNYKISEINNKADKKRLLFYNNETQTWEKPILREWDSIEKHANGKYYYHQRSGEVVLNGSENWGLNTVGNDTSRFYLNFPSIKPTGNNLSTSNLVIDKLIEISYSDIATKDIEGISVHGTGNQINLRLSNAKLQTQDVQGFKQWLQANNVTVVYQLAQEKVYECTNIDLITYNGETNYVVESGVIVPKTTLKVHNNISNVVSLLQKKVSLLESNMIKYMITQNRLMLASRYNADTVSFKVDVATLRNSFEYDNDLYELILNNILVGKDNYNREYIENLIIFYWMDFIISDEMYSTLFEIIEEQHNPKIEEEAPLI